MRTRVHNGSVLYVYTYMYMYTTRAIIPRPAYIDIGSTSNITKFDVVSKTKISFLIFFL